MRSNWYMAELQKAILDYRETIAALEQIKRNARPGERSELWWEETEIRIQHLKQSITSLENSRGTSA